MRIEGIKIIFRKSVADIKDMYRATDLIYFYLAVYDKYPPSSLGTKTKLINKIKERLTCSN